MDETKDATPAQPSSPPASVPPAQPRPALSGFGSNPENLGQKNQQRWRGISLVFLCFVAGAIGSALVLFAQGDVRKAATDHSTTREVVSNEAELIASIAEEIGKSTVSINTETVTQNSYYSSVQEGAGTGIIISADGYVLTNKHVIPEGVRTVSVITSDGTEYENVRVVGRDQLNDIAFLKIEKVSGLTPAKINKNAEVQVGQKVIALGNALGQYQNTVTTGVISGIGRPIATQGNSGNVERLENLLQTDAAINPGNSGGPLINLDGEVIGVNTAVAQGAEGIGFAIPINDVVGLIDNLNRTGRVVRAYLGVRAVTLTPQVAKEIGVSVKDGAYVVENGVVNGSPASKGGLQSKDIVTKVNEQKVDRNHSLSGVISRFRPGEQVTLTILRDGRAQTLSVKLEELRNQF